MSAPRTVIIGMLAMASVMCSATAQPPDSPRKDRKSEVPFRITSAAVQRFGQEQPSRKGPYREALVLVIEASVADYEALPPSIEAFLYIGDHELKPLKFEWGREHVLVTFHDPRWRDLRAAPMVLTIEHGEPIRNPQRYADYPKFDPRIIRPE